MNAPWLNSKSTTLLAGLTLAAAAAGCQSDTSSQPTANTTHGAKPNILFILADDAGYGDLGCYGQKIIQTPNLDKLATQGVRFMDFYAGAPVCAPSRNALMTGQHTGHTIIRGNAKVDLRPEDTTVAEVLKAAGYTTGLVGKWGLGSENSPGTPNKKGFDFFYGYVDQTHAHNYYPTFLVRNETREPLRNVVPNMGQYGQGVASVKVDYSDDFILAEGLKFMEAHKNGPFFLYYASTLPHANDEAKPNGSEIPSQGIYAQKDWPEPDKGYAAMVTRLDDDAGKLLAKLDELGIANNTIVIFTSDNGPQAEGGHDAAFFNSSGGLRGIKRDVYEGGIREPFIARWPGHITPGTTSNQSAYFVDWMATASSIAGVKPPDHGDGISFLPALLGDAKDQQQHDYLYWEFFENGTSQAVRMGDWKAVRTPMITGPMQLYDLNTDVGEQHNVAAQHPDIVAKAAADMAEAHVPSKEFPAPSEK
ncbi:MAG TPA: arylsulfatase [Opitutales bacterium]|nr:arylsulfatase [Opitutales bacterium]